MKDIFPLLKVMYCPIDYIHVDWYTKQDQTLSQCVRKIINGDIIHRFNLNNEIGLASSTCDIGRTLISQWSHIPMVTWMIGCKISKGGLALQGKLSTLPDYIRNFIALPVTCPTLKPEGALNRTEVERIGVQYVAQLRSLLPTPLEQRLKLALPNTQSIVDSLDYSINRSLIMLAFDYAKKNKP